VRRRHPFNFGVFVFSRNRKKKTKKKKKKKLELARTHQKKCSSEEIKTKKRSRKRGVIRKPWLNVLYLQNLQAAAQWLAVATVKKFRQELRDLVELVRFRKATIVLKLFCRQRMNLLHQLPALARVFLLRGHGKDPDLKINKIIIKIKIIMEVHLRQQQRRRRRRLEVACCRQDVVVSLLDVAVAFDWALSMQSKSARNWLILRVDSNLSLSLPELLQTKLNVPMRQILVASKNRVRRRRRPMFLRGR
jgi:hypothetical protein